MFSVSGFFKELSTSLFWRLVHQGAFLQTFPDLTCPGGSEALPTLQAQLPIPGILALSI